MLGVNLIDSDPSETFLLEKKTNLVIEIKTTRDRFIKLFWLGT